jgi:hypothetical protein
VLFAHFAREGSSDPKLEPLDLAIQLEQSIIVGVGNPTTLKSLFEYLIV